MLGNNSFDLVAILQMALIVAIPLVFAITLHEVGHGYMAYRLGDPTAKLMGRLTLNPIKHIDAIGTVVLPLALLVMSGGSMVFGWAKPVPVDARNFKKLRRDEALVSFAGPAANLVMAIIWAMLLAVGSEMELHGETLGRGLHDMAKAGVVINVVFMVLNLLPLPPLDGGHLVAALLPPRTAMSYNRIAPYGIPILFVLAFTGVLFYIIGPIINALLSLFGIHYL